MARILLADDDKELGCMLSQYLANEGFEVAIAGDGQEALEMLANDNIDLVVLDVMMPGKNGFEVLREIRKRSMLPVLMLTARGDDVDSIVGLEMGADDYLSKPCNPNVLAARIRAILRRSEAIAATQAVNVRDLVLHSDSRTAICAGRNILLTSMECNLLEMLLQQAGRVVSRGDLSEKALGRKLGPSDRTLDVHISNLRQKLGAAQDGSERIKTIWGLGYLYAA